MSRSPCRQVCYAKELKEGFVEYTEQVVKLMVPLLKFYFHDDILSLSNVPVHRAQSISLSACPIEMPFFLNCATRAGGRSRVHAPPPGVRTGARACIPHRDVAFHV